MSTDERFFAQAVLGVRAMGSNVLGILRIVYSKTHVSQCTSLSAGI